MWLSCAYKFFTLKFFYKPTTSDSFRKLVKWEKGNFIIVYPKNFKVGKPFKLNQFFDFSRSQMDFITVKSLFSIFYWDY